MLTLAFDIRARDNFTYSFTGDINSSIGIDRDNIVVDARASYPNSTKVMSVNTDPPQEAIEVPIKVNVLKNVTITDENISEIVSNANYILWKDKTGIDLFPLRINRDVSDGDNDDGTIQEDEWGGLIGDGIDELNCEFRSWYARMFYPNAGKGYKVYIANELTKASSGGESLHTVPGARSGTVYPVSSLAKSTNLTSMGIALAHEFCHAMTVARESADDRSNLMYPFIDTLRTDTRLNQDQITEVRKGAEKQGYVKRKGSWFDVDTKRAMWTDPIGDNVSQEYIDLFTGSLFAENSTSDLEVEIGLAGLFPNLTDVNLRFEMGFDTDNNTNTGYFGVDKILQITLQGEYPFPNGSIIADLYDVASNTSVSLAPGQVIRVQEIVDFCEPPILEPSPFLDSIEQSLPLPLLGPLADNMPIDVWATNLDTGEYDWASFQFDFNPPPRASIEMNPLEASPGRIVNVRGIRFPPLSKVTLFIDDTEILQTTTLDDGTFSIWYTVPYLSAGLYFVTAMSALIDSLDFDYSILTVTSPAISGINLLEGPFYWNGVEYWIVQIGDTRRGRMVSNYY